MCDLNQIQTKDKQAVNYRKQSVTIDTSSFDFNETNSPQQHIPHIRPSKQIYEGKRDHDV